MPYQTNYSTAYVYYVNYSTAYVYYVDYSTAYVYYVGILLNLSEDKENHELLVSGGFLHLLASWIRSTNNELKSLGM